jgi:hypothetical protein
MPKIRSIPAVVATCLQVLYRLDENDEIEFLYSSSPSDADLDYCVQEITEIPENLTSDFFEEQRELLAQDAEELELYTERDIKVVTIETPDEVYKFLVLGENGAMAITYINKTENLIYFYAPYIVEDISEDLPPTFYWHQIQFSNGY